jgi:hypothetical protein
LKTSLVALALVAVSLVLPMPARSAPVLDLSWSAACSPITHDRVLPPGETSSTLFVLESGIDSTHVGYGFRILMGPTMDCGPAGGTGVPDAWRFDPQGCQGTAFREIAVTTNSKTCPALAGPSTPVSILDVAYDPFGGPMLVTVFVNYQPTPQAPNPNQTHQAARILFDHTKAVTGAGTPGVTCGGFEKPMCFALWGGRDFRGFCHEPSVYTNGSWISTSGIEHPFLRSAESVNSFRIDPGIQACNLATPAEPRTWGSLKAQYR